MAEAQQVALNRFEPAPAGDRFFGVPSPYAAGELDLHLMLLGDYAHDPLVIATESGEDPRPIVEHQLFAHLNATLAIANRLAINVDVPVALFQAGDSPDSPTGSFPSPSGVEFGDLRAGLRLRLVGGYYDPFQLGIGGYVWFPTAKDAADSYVGGGSVRGFPQLLLGGRGGPVVWSLAGGPELRATRTLGDIEQSHLIHWGAGLGVIVGDGPELQIGPELRGAANLGDTPEGAAPTVNLEGLLGAKLRFARNFELGLGGGAGFTNAVGTPDARGVFSLAYTPEQPRPSQDRDGDKILDPVDACVDTPGIADPDPKKHGCPPPPPPKDTDGDLIADEKDACPTVPGIADPDPKKHGCPPPPDTDKDGIIDEKDACPTEPGVPSDDPAKNGCPLPKDRDGDGVTDDVDACPDVPGVKTADPKTNGCPPDTDGDGIVDDKDACPTVKGEPDPDPKKNGCPKGPVQVTETEIVILEQVQFDTGRATIKPVSDPLLDAVARVINEHPEIKKLEVQGHTDSTGARALNTRLSQSRADAVKKALVKRKVDAARLTTKGYGPDVPIADNATPEGKQANRRVQFKITEKEGKKPAP